MKLKAEEQEKAKADKEKETVARVAESKADGAGPTQPLKTATSSAEQDLDVFLLGDLGDSDDGAGVFAFSLFRISGKRITVCQNTSLLVCFFESIACIVWLVSVQLKHQRKVRRVRISLRMYQLTKEMTNFRTNLPSTRLAFLFPWKDKFV